MTVLAVLGGDMGSVANATVDCNQTYSPTRDKEALVRINSGTFDLITGVSQLQGRHAFHLAAGLWNELTDGLGFFTFLGTTGVSDLDANECATGNTWNLVVVEDDCDDYSAYFETRCSGTRWQIVVCAALDGNPLDWVVGENDPVNPPATDYRRDMPSLMAHELGHALGLDHPWDTYSAGIGCDHAATMSYRCYEAGVPLDLRREMFRYDIKCDTERNGRMERNSEFATTVDGAVTGSGTFYANVGFVHPRMTTGETYTSGLLYDGSHHAFVPFGLEHITTATTSRSRTNAMTSWPEGPDTESYSSMFVNLNTAASYPHDDWSQRPRMSRYQGNFTLSSFTHHWQQRCSNSWPSSSCTSVQVRSHYEPVVAYINAGTEDELPVFLFVESTRAGGSVDRMMRMHVGTRGSSGTIAGPSVSLLNRRSSVKPGLACDGNVCQVFYVPVNSSINRIFTMSVTITPTSQSTTSPVQISPVSTTTTAIAAWTENRPFFSTNYTWVAFRTVGTGHAVHMIRGVGQNWSSGTLMDTISSAVAGPRRGSEARPAAGVESIIEWISGG